MADETDPLAVELLFNLPPLDQPADLVFGDTEGPAVPDTTFALVGVLPATTLTGTVRIAVVVPLEMSGTLPATVITGDIAALYVSGASRPTVGKVSTSWQKGTEQESGALSAFQQASVKPARAVASWQRADSLSTLMSAWHQDGDPAGFTAQMRFEAALRLQTRTVKVDHEETLRHARPTRTARYQEATRLATLPLPLRHEDTLRVETTPLRSAWQEGVGLTQGTADHAGKGLQLVREWPVIWQEAWRPRPGTSDVIRPPVEPCYVPSPHLVFADAPMGLPAALLFVCERHVPIPPDPGTTIIIPTQGVYIVNNSAILKRAENSVFLPVLAMKLSFDYKSWSWGFSATLPARALDDLQKGDDGKVHVESTINGIAHRFILDSISRSRSFNQATLSVTGRSRSAVLAAPNAPVTTFRNTSAMTAQQIANMILTANGVSIGWAVEWEPTDWLVPANVFTHQGTFMTALLAVADAAGAYIRPHFTDESMTFVLKYPVAPWAWSDPEQVTADYELPEAATTVEDITWEDKPVYDRVFVSGQQAGVRGNIKRGGTAGTALAPMVTDPLITTGPAARQRGIPVLADTGPQATVSVRTPILEDSGLIIDGKFVRYIAEGQTRLGLTRGVDIDVSRTDDGPLEVWQTLQLETHE